MKHCQLFFDLGKFEVEHESGGNPTVSSHADTPAKTAAIDTKSKTTSTNLAALSTVSPAEIHERLSSLPPLQVEDAAKYYHGIEVAWQVAFVGVSTMFDGNQQLRANTDTIGFSVSCPVDLAQYPQLKVMLRYAPFTIRGTIVSAAIWAVDLENCTLLFE